MAAPTAPLPPAIAAEFLDALAEAPSAAIALRQIDVGRRLTGFELWFVPAQGAQPKFKFPCDEQGGVDMNSLGRLKLNDYLYARAESKFASLFQRVVSRL